MDGAIRSAHLVNLLAPGEDFPEDVPRMTDDELRYFVAGLRDDTIFTSMHIHSADKEKGDLSRIFAPVGAGLFQKAPEQFKNNIGVVWDWMSQKAKKTWKGSISGISYPTFVSATVCHKDDWDIACNSIKAIKASTPLIIAP